MSPQNLKQPFMIYPVIKRMLDVVCAVIGIVGTSPLWLLAIVGILVSDWGPLFYTAHRIGRGNRPFKMYKFRSMRVLRQSRAGAEASLRPDADRIFPFGNFIRKVKIDELPQLINVLKGDMALIGPRPLLVQYLPLYSKEQARRHDVRPGISGWAQCHGRNAISWTEKFKLDVWYVDHCTLMTDLKVIFITIKKVLVRDGISAEGQATMEAFNGKN